MLNVTDKNNSKCLKNSKTLWNKLSNFVTLFGHPEARRNFKTGPILEISS